MPVIWIQMVVYYVVYRWWWRIDPRTIEAREKGLILRSRGVILWKDIKRHHWKGSDPLCLVLQLQNAVIDLRLLPRDKEAFDRLLDEMCGTQCQ